MSEEPRDPCLDPGIDDVVYYRAGKNGAVTGRYRRVLNRADNDIVYVDHNGITRKCWLTVWMDFWRTVDVERCEKGIA
jgi:hypothetical protein